VAKKEKKNKEVDFHRLPRVNARLRSANAPLMMPNERRI